MQHLANNTNDNGRDVDMVTLVHAVRMWSVYKGQCQINMLGICSVLSDACYVVVVQIEKVL